MKISGDLKDLSEIRGSPKVISVTSKKADDDLKGYLHMLIVTTKGLRQITKTRSRFYKYKIRASIDFNIVQ